jgi:hypothetical protein
MALSVHDCAGYLRRRLDGESSIPVLVLCNWAGEHLTNMHPWGWLERPPASLDLLEGNSWINLPSDFGRAIGKPRPTGSSTVSLEWATMDEIASLRSGEATSQLSLYGAISWTSSIEGVLKARIELSAEIQTTAEDSLLLAYRAKWYEVVNDDDLLRIPSWLEPLYLEVLFVYAQAYDEHDLGSLSARLLEIESSPVFMAARNRDGGVQPSVGKMSGGAVQLMEMPVARSVGLAGRVADPT